MQQQKSALVLTCSLQRFRLGKDEEGKEGEMKWGRVLSQQGTSKVEKRMTGG